MRATTEPEGLEEERRWLHDQFPGWRKTAQKLVFSDDGRAFDYVDVSTPDGQSHEVCFDISSFFGKY